VQYYSVYEPEDEGTDLTVRADRLAFVKEGFAWPALIFGVFWLLYHRMWNELIAYIAVFGGLQWLLASYTPAENLTSLVMLGLTVLFALEANDLRGAALKRRGYRLTGVAIGPDRGSAELSFFRSWLPQQKRSEEMDRAPHQPPLSETPRPLLRHQGDEVIGLFPNA